MHAMNRRWMNLLLGLTLLAMPSAAVAQTGEPFMQIPAAGLVDLDEGAIECWVKFGFDPMEPHPDYRGRAMLLHLDLGDDIFPGDGIAVSLGTKEMGRRTPTGRATLARVGVTIEGREPGPPLFPDFGDSARRDVWYHLAFTWRGREMRAYVNGQRPGTDQDLPIEVYPQPLKAALSHAARLCVGNVPGRWPLDNPVAIDELRISSIARQPKDLGFAGRPLVVDRYTLLLVNFDQPADQTFTPAYAAIDAARIVVPMPPQAGWVDGKFGKALALSAQAFAK